MGRSRRGIASSEAFGSADRAFSGQFATPVGILSAGAYGIPTLTKRLAFLNPSAIASAQAYGTPTVTPILVFAYPTGIASAQAMGASGHVTSAKLLFPTAIASAQAMGAPVLKWQQFIRPTGLTSQEAVATGSQSVLHKPLITSQNTSVLDLSGGQTFAVFGTFDFITSVTFDGSSVSFGSYFESDTLSPNYGMTGLSITTPSHAAGTVTMTVTNAAGSASTTVEFWDPTAFTTDLEYYFDARKDLTLGTGNDVSSWKEQVSGNTYSSSALVALGYSKPQKIANAFASGVPGVDFTNAGLTGTRKAYLSSARSIRFTAKPTGINANDFAGNPFPHGFQASTPHDSTVRPYYANTGAAGPLIGDYRSGTPIIASTSTTVGDGYVGFEANDCVIARKGVPTGCCMTINTVTYNTGHTGAPVFNASGTLTPTSPGTGSLYGIDSDASAAMWSGGYGTNVVYKDKILYHMAPVTGVVSGSEVYITSSPDPDASSAPSTSDHWSAIGANHSTLTCYTGPFPNDAWSAWGFVGCTVTVGYIFCVKRVLTSAENKKVEDWTRMTFPSAASQYY